ncbi:cation diffusion facilitator family transporter [Thermogemmata fonticola]|uniref:Cation transporter n=1 Tax=Thermogemmata fonticola TaxID=2755323 RepID=A0A7V8VGP0_9BACT|nr:cation diffusion facilitator family transporter [Thermogemmata fonticola]MBA2227472.1 cation transporter [Thermogemmata fonticola]
MADNREPVQVRWPLVLSIGAAVLTLALKAGAAWWTGSVGLLTDALESLVNLTAAATAYIVVWYAARPADRTHAFGHEKIEYFSSGLEGVLIGVAGIGTAAYALQRWWQPVPLQGLETGTIIGAIAAAINWLVARVLLQEARRIGSIVLEADGRHLMSDVWTSAAVLAGLLLVLWTGWTWIDSLLALGVSLNIIWTGSELVVRSFHGLMDRALPEAEQERIREVLRQQLGDREATFHMLRTRRAGQRRFVEFHLLLPGATPIRAGHQLVHSLEEALRREFPGTEVMVHLEPIEESCSWEKEELARLGEVTEPNSTKGQPKPTGMAERTRK